MRLTQEEFNSLVKIQWLEKTTKDGIIYYSPVDEVSTRLFNLDLLKKILVTKFRAQPAIITIPNYDLSQPVLLFPDLTLKLPPELEIISNTSLAIKRDKTNIFMINMSLNRVVLVFLLIISTVIVIITIHAKHECENYAKIITHTCNLIKMARANGVKSFLLSRLLS